MSLSAATRRRAKDAFWESNSLSSALIRFRAAPSIAAKLKSRGSCSTIVGADLDPYQLCCDLRFTSSPEDPGIEQGLLGVDLSQCGRRS